MLWIAPVSAIVMTHLLAGDEMNTSRKSMQRLRCTLMIALGMACTASAQVTVKMRIIDPANTDHPAARAQQIGSRNVIRFRERTEKIVQPAPAAVQHRVAPAPAVAGPVTFDPPAAPAPRTQSFAPAGRIMQSIQQRQMPPVPRTASRVPATFQRSGRVRLAQANSDPENLLDALGADDDGPNPLSSEDEDFDSLLERARDLIDDESDDGADMSPDDVRRRMQDDLDSLLTDEDDEGDSPLGLDDDDDDLDEEDDFDESQYVDPTPDPIRRSANTSNQPYTLGSIFQDEEYDPNCVQQYCNAVWQCAGGRCQNWWDRLKRSIERDDLVRNSQCCGMPGSPLANFKCPKVPRQDQNRPGQGQMAGPGGQGGHWEPVYAGEGGGVPQPADGLVPTPYPADVAPLEISPQPADIEPFVDGAAGSGTR